MTEKVKNDYKLKRSERKPNLSKLFGLSLYGTLLITIGTNLFKLDIALGIGTIACWLVFVTFIVFRNCNSNRLVGFMVALIGNGGILWWSGLIINLFVTCTTSYIAGIC